MHEYGIAQEILTVIGKYLKEYEGFEPVKCTVKVGALTGINPESLEAAFPVAAEGSGIENLLFRVSMEPIKCRCRNCNSSIVIDEFIDMLACENCGSPDIEHPSSAQKIHITQLEIKKGDEVRVIDLSEVEVEEDEHNHKH